MVEQHPTREARSVLNNWVGHRVVVKYMGGPDEPLDPNDPKGLSRGEAEARSGVFHLHRFGPVGIEVSNEMDDALMDRVTLIPWGAVLSVRGTSPEERGGPEGRISREQMAKLARVDPT